MPASSEEVIRPDESHTAYSRLIAIAVDSSNYSEYAFDWMIINIARPETDQILILNVYPMVSAIAVDITPQNAMIEAANKQHSHDVLQSYAKRAPAKVFNMRGVSLRGDPREIIPRKVAELKVDMLVIGSRGLTGFKKAMLGSVSDYLVNHSTVPVLVCHPPLISSSLI
ncbi:hypothetical protein BDR26DRAFT_799109 [Obelidium mucronatum]|nr:hypothetical protein BDR26DRAFT_799109 [Obelidium mucronatum]